MKREEFLKKNSVKKTASFPHLFSSWWSGTLKRFGVLKDSMGSASLFGVKGENEAEVYWLEMCEFALRKRFSYLQLEQKLLEDGSWLECKSAVVEKIEHVCKILSKRADPWGQQLYYSKKSMHLWLALVGYSHEYEKVWRLHMLNVLKSKGKGLLSLRKGSDSEYQMRMNLLEVITQSSRESILIENKNLLDRKSNPYELKAKSIDLWHDLGFGCTPFDVLYLMGSPAGLSLQQVLQTGALLESKEKCWDVMDEVFKNIRAGKFFNMKMPLTEGSVWGMHRVAAARFLEARVQEYEALQESQALRQQLEQSGAGQSARSLRL